MHTGIKVNFGFTPHIFRYIEELIELEERTFASVAKHEVEIENFKEGEARSPEIVLNNGQFWVTLEMVISTRSGISWKTLGPTLF